MNGQAAVRDHQRRKRRFAGRHHPVNEKRLVTARLQARVEQGHVARGPADIEASDDPEDLHERPVNPQVVQ